MVPRFPITVSKVRLLKPRYKTGFLDLQLLGNLPFFLHVFIGMPKITFLSCNAVTTQAAPCSQVPWWLHWSLRTTRPADFQLCSGLAVAVAPTNDTEFKAGDRAVCEAERAGSGKEQTPKGASPLWCSRAGIRVLLPQQTPPRPHVL